MENLRTEESFLARLPRGHDEEASTKLRYPFALLKIVTHFFNFKIIISTTVFFPLFFFLLGVGRVRVQYNHNHAINQSIQNFPT